MIKPPKKSNPPWCAELTRCVGGVVRYSDDDKSHGRYSDNGNSNGRYSDSDNRYNKNKYDDSRYGNRNNNRVSENTDPYSGEGTEPEKVVGILEVVENDD